MSDVEQTNHLVLDLAAPLEVKGKSISAITLREPIVRHVRQAERVLIAGHGQAELRLYQIKLVAGVTGLDEEHVSKLPIRILNAATRWLQPMINRKTEEGPAEQPDTHVLTLDPPVELSNRTVSELFLREPTAKEMQLAESHLRGQFGAGQVRSYEVALVSRVSGVSEAVIESLLITQHNEAIQYIENFSNAGQRIGAI
jgi:hypothetical protein